MGSASYPNGVIVGIDSNATSPRAVFYDSKWGGGASPVYWNAAWPGDNQWVHWAIVFNNPSNTVSLYINGSLVSTQPTVTDYSAVPGKLMIGRALSFFATFDGKMSHYAFWAGTTLKGTQVRTIYNAGLPGLS